MPSECSVASGLPNGRASQPCGRRVTKMPIPDDFNAADYRVEFADTYYEGPWVDAPLVLKVFKVGQYLGSVLKAARRCLQVDADIPDRRAGCGGLYRWFPRGPRDETCRLRRFHE